MLETNIMLEMKMEDKDCNLENKEAISEENPTENKPETSEENTEDAKMADLESKYVALNDSFLRLNAEFDNYRKRTVKEKADLLKSGSEKVLLDVIPVVDDLERAIENIDKAENLEALKVGVDLIYQKFLNFLGKYKVQEIEAIGQPFDTDKHEALTTIPATGEEDKDKVVDCIQKGYTLDDKIIRYSKVIVAK